MAPPMSLKHFVSVSLLSALFAIPIVAQQPDQAEIVRISYLEGDVRISPAKDGHPKITAQQEHWFTAVRGFNLSEGDTIATSKGRVEIEFENGSTVYLADDSVLELETLESPTPPDMAKLGPLLKRRKIDPDHYLANFAAHAGPRSEVFLLAGTLTLNFVPAPNEKFSVASPSGRIERFEKQTQVRLDSYLDGLEMTPFNPGGAIDHPENGAAIQIQQDQTAAYFNDGTHTLSISTYSSAPFDWNSWVANRISVRDAELKSAMAAAHLDHFAPGILDLYEAGNFFACAPYTCWQPNDETQPPDDAEAEPSSPDAATGATDLVPVAFAPAGHVPRLEDLAIFQQSQSTQDLQTQSAPQSQSQPPLAQQRRYVTYRPNFDCTQTRVVYEIDPVTHRRRTVEETTVSDPWAGATCYGDYFHFHRRFYFVAGQKHHHPPFNPVKCHHHNGYVLRSPSDVRGKSPANLKYGVFEGSRAEGYHLTPVAAGERVQVLTSMPKEFVPASPIHALSTTAAPRIEAHSLYAAEAASHDPTAKADVPAINFDYGRHAFVTESIATPTKPSSTVVVGKVDSYGGFDGVRVPLTSQRAGFSGPAYTHVGIASSASFHGSGQHNGNSGGSQSAHNSSSSGGYHGGSSGSGGGYHSGSSGGAGGGYHGGGGGSSGGGSHAGGGGGGFSGGVGGGGSHGGGGGGGHGGRG